MTRVGNVSDSARAPKTRFSLRWMLIAFAVLSLILWLGVAARNYGIKHRAEVAEQTKAIWATLIETSKAAEQIRTSQGRAPNGRAEIEAMVGHPMRVKVSREHWREIEYKPTSPNSYQLYIFVEWVDGFDGDFLVFDSTVPHAGWTPFYD
jgi:hypothetical protein